MRSETGSSREARTSSICAAKETAQISEKKVASSLAAPSPSFAIARGPSFGMGLRETALAAVLLRSERAAPGGRGEAKRPEEADRAEPGGRASEAAGARRSPGLEDAGRSKCKAELAESSILLRGSSVVARLVCGGSTRSESVSDCLRVDSGGGEPAAMRAWALAASVAASRPLGFPIIWK